MSEAPPADGGRTADERQRIDAICVSNLLDSLGAIVFFKDLEGRFLRVSLDCAQLTGRTPDEMVGLTDFDLTDHDHAVALRADEQRIIATGEPLIAKEEVDRMVNRPGTWVETSKFALRDHAGTIIGTFGFSHEITRYEVAERQIVRMAQEAAVAHAEIARVERQLQAVLRGSTDAIAKYDRALRYEYLNPAGERSRGSTLEHLLGRTDRETGMARNVLRVYEPALRRVLETGESGDVEFFVPSGQRGTDSTDAWFHVVLAPDHDASGDVVGVLTSTRDISELKRAEVALTHQAMHDSLTGLANRLLLTDRLSQALVRMARFSGGLVLFFIDLDYFKAVNDTQGHEAGDRVLVIAARRLEQVVRLQDTVARLGGDEFIVLCDRVMTIEEVNTIAARMVAALAEPFTDGAETFRLSASVGAAITSDPKTGPAELMRCADSAMYQAKQDGRNRFVVFDPLDTRA
ncbi:GGDEF domain-containing protein [Pengzhenrongella sp.]|jgi:diguanylate cyclase (GGDEF)-like protein/PAS domain S-box-containing protein|uniref:GGDEF domain-containing protein n=1 Tax=Pengzhenrongella sp. TaxID=2888820 RepID=UPI002F95E1EB